MPRHSPLLLLSATELASRIRTREISATEVVATHIAHAKRENESLNAIVHDRYDAALDEARLADEKLARGIDREELPPFFGVPFTIKEAFQTTGMPNSAGLLSRKDVRAESDATAVARLRAAGAIPIGVTNVSELCMWMESSNPVYGTTNNAYDSSRTAGGSSGGEGAIVGAGGVPFGLGADVGGSIRMPAFFNGVFGHKPGGGIVPNTGQFPTAENDALLYLSTGPIVRRAADLWPLLSILRGPDGLDTRCTEMGIGDPDAVAIRGLSVFDVEDNGRIAVSDDLRRAQKRVARALAHEGAIVRSVSFDGLRHSLEIWASMLGVADDSSFAARMGGGEPVLAGRELLKWLLGRSVHTLPAIGLALLEKLAKMSASQMQRFVALGIDLRNEITHHIGPGGIMLFPSYPEVAPRHNTPLLLPFKWIYTAIFNVLEFPVTQVPLGMTEEGLPLGVQVVSTKGNDHITIRVAMELERIFGGWVPPWQVARRSPAPKRTRALRSRLA